MGIASLLLVYLFPSSAPQALSKWSSRFDLGLSTTVPVIQFEPRNIVFIEDLRGCLT